MQIKQQQQIRAFLSEKFGGDSDSTLFERQEALLQGCIARTEGKSPNQMKTLTETILPRVALYKALSEHFPHEDAYKTMRAYMLEIVAPEKHSSTAKMEAIPGFYFLYSRIFLRVVRIPIRTTQIFHPLLAVISNRQNRRKALKSLGLLRNQNHPKLSSFIRCYP